MNAIKPFLLAVAAATALSAAAEDREIAEDYVLEQDETVAGTLTVADGVTVHLNGHRLTAAAIAGAGTISGGRLPAGYRELEYAEFTGGQWIDSGVKAKTSDGGSVKIAARLAPMHDGTGPYNSIASLLGNGQDAGLWVALVKWTYIVTGAGSWYYVTPIEIGTPVDVSLKWEKSKAETAVQLTVDGAVVSQKADNTAISTDYTLYIGTRNDNGRADTNYGKFKLYSMQFYRPQTTLVRDYIPARRISDDVAGLFDAVSGDFFPSASGTPFVAGAEGLAGGGELCLDVPDGVDFVNSTATFTGTLKFVKRGSGTYTSAKQQLYSGGTAVEAGRIRFQRSATSTFCGFGSWGRDVAVSPGAQIVINADYQTLNGYRVTIAGDGPDGKGAIHGNASGELTAWNATYLGSLVLSGDASITVVRDDAFNLNNNGKNGGTINVALNGHTLTGNGSARWILWSANVVDEGTIAANISPGSNGQNNCLYTHGNGLRAPLATLDVKANSALGGEQPATVGNLVMGGTYYPRNGSSYLTTVLGRYTPKSTSGGWPKVALGDATHLAPTFDLSDLASAYDGSRGISFEPGSSVTVHVGAREIAVGDKLVSWDAAPDISVTFSLTGDGWTAAEREIALAARGDGLYVKTTAAPAFATLDVENDAWLFFAADGSPYSEEWTQGVTSDMQVRFASYPEYTAIKAKGVSPSMFVMKALAIPEGAGAVDLTSGMDFQFDEGIVIDVKGNSLKLPAGMMFGDKAFTVTSSVAGGEIVIDVASGVSRNTAMTLSGSLKVTKRGAGTFASHLEQSYDGGTYVEQGRVQPPDAPASNDIRYCHDQFKAFGTNHIHVARGAAFDLRGNYAYRTLPILEGGTLLQTGPAMTITGAGGSGIGAVLGMDSYVSNTAAIVFGDVGANRVANLNGHTLHISNNGGFYLRSALTNGTVEVSEVNGWFAINDPLDMRTTTLDNSCAIQVNKDVEIGEYIQRRDTQYMLGTSKLTVHRRFCPIAETHFYGCTMLDGSTLDLSQRTTLFTAHCTNHETGNNTKTYRVTFPEGAKINVEIGARRPANGERLVAWNEDEAPAGTVTFTPVRGGERIQGRMLRAHADGLYFEFIPGTGIYIR